MTKLITTNSCWAKLFPWIINYFILVERMKNVGTLPKTGWFWRELFHYELFYQSNPFSNLKMLCCMCVLLYSFTCFCSSTETAQFLIIRANSSDSKSPALPTCHIVSSHSSVGVLPTFCIPVLWAHWRQKEFCQSTIPFQSSLFVVLFAVAERLFSNKNR